jgi:hypothetical protein
LGTLFFATGKDGATSKRNDLTAKNSILFHFVDPASSSFREVTTNLI